MGLDRAARFRTLEVDVLPHGEDAGIVGMFKMEQAAVSQYGRLLHRLKSSVKVFQGTGGNCYSCVKMALEVRLIALYQ
jgi:hypothetical protein